VAERLDPITLEVIRNRLQYVTREMSAAIVKTAVSPVISEARDFSSIVYDADGRIVATASTVPFHFGVSSDAIAAVRARYGRSIAPGDVFLANDPHDGGGLHLQDVVVMRPMYAGRTRIGWASASGHMIDMGGMVPGSFAPGARECFQEGVRVPPVRLVRDERPVDDVWRLLLNNVRQSEVVSMDLRSLVAGTHVAADRVRTLRMEVGAAAFDAALRALPRLSEDVLRRRIRALPDGEYLARAWAELDADAFLVRCLLRVSRGGLEFDYTGSAPQCPYFFNSKPHIVRSELVVRVHQILAPDVPFTDGILRPVRVVAPEGSIVNARPPAPIAAAHMHVGLLAMELGETCLKKAVACAPDGDGVAAARARITAPGGTTGMGLSTWHATAPVASTFLVMDGNGVGAGGRADRDGIDMTGSNYGGPGLVYPDVETVEQAYPVRYLEKRLRRDAGGAGRTRGGASVEAAFTAHGTARLDGTTLGMRRSLPLAGLFGGYPGACTAFTREPADGAPAAVPHGATGIPLAPGDAFRFANASGSGLGDPLERDAARVLADVRDGYVGAEAARAVYGVVAAANGRDVDAAATDAARAAIRAARLARAAAPREGNGAASGRVGATPGPAGRTDARVVGRLSATVDVVRDGGALVARCAACAATLARAPGAWQDGAAVAETTVGSPAYAAIAAVWAPDRAAAGLGAPAILRELFCPRCAGLLQTDVVLAGTPSEPDARPAFWGAAR